ncbi:MAG: hypothetical protein HYY16_06835 [Planctomycetes bacterium]|nr:hypothetical protein [Planctomycetota bacterium]
MGHRWAIPSLPVAGAAGLGYLAFLIHAAVDRDGFLILDNVNLLFHEAGHVLLGCLGLISGTIAELVFPIATLAVFIRRRELMGAAFGAFWIGEDLRYIGRYVADARARVLPLVGAGDHDWNILLLNWGMLDKDLFLGGSLNVLGWILMIGAVLTMLTLSALNRLHEPSDLPD